MSDELAAAFRRTEVLGNEKIDRRNWTTSQWADDAERIMSNIDGASSALLNGHIAALIRTIRNLRESTKPRTVTEYGIIFNRNACGLIPPALSLEEFKERYPHETGWSITDRDVYIQRTRKAVDPEPGEWEALLTEPTA